MIVRLQINYQMLAHVTTFNTIAPVEPPNAGLIMIVMIWLRFDV